MVLLSVIMTPYKIAFVGPPSSGKTVAATLMNNFFKEMGVDSVLVPEYARIHMEATGKPISSYGEQLAVTTVQSDLEKAILRSKPEIIITDSPVFLGEVFHKTYYPEVSPKHFITLSQQHKYDIVFRLTRLPLVNDGIRYQTEEEQALIDESINKTIDAYASSGLIHSVIPLSNVFLERQQTIRDVIHRRWC